MNAIDVRRGVTIKRHKASGMYVYMYKNAPGVYMDAFGREIPRELAKLAGFPVETLAKLKEKIDKVAMFQSELEKQLELDSEAGEITYAEKGEYRVVQLPAGRGQMFDTAGHKLTDVMPLEQVMILFNQLTGDENGGAKTVGGAEASDGEDGEGSKREKGASDGRKKA